MTAQKNNWLSYSNAGFQIGASLLIFGWIGFKIDDYLLSDPYALIGGLLIGGIFSLYGLWSRFSSEK